MDGVPLELSGFIGRGEELRAIGAALDSARLVSLVGPGGCGKTRLAIRAAHDAAGFEDVRWADLAAVADPAAVTASVAAALGVLRIADRDAVAVLAGQLAGRRLLLCLDNCEHVLEAAADVVGELLRSCPRLTVLCTSREALRLPGETVWRVPPMSRGDSVRLFAARAQDSAGAADDPVIATACARMEGMPLAVELAAAWSGVLSPQEILDGLDDRFRLLVRGPHGVAARHQTLAASMEWSHGLLGEADRGLLQRLAVFRGGFTAAAAQALCAGEEPVAVLEGLRRLVEKSLLTADTGGAVTRFRMLETVREFAEQRLVDAGESAAVRDRHLAACLALARSLRPLIETDKDAWRAAVSDEYENLHAAIHWGLSLDDPSGGRDLAAELPWFWHSSRRGREGLSLLRRAVALGDGERTPLQARLLTGLALVADTNEPTAGSGTAAAAFALAEEVGEPRSAALALALAAIDRFYDDLDAARAMAADARERGARLGDGFVRDSADVLAGIVHHLRDDHRQAAALLEAGRRGLVPRGDREVASTACGLLAVSTAHGGDLRRAAELAREALALAEPLGDYHRVGAARVALATVERWAGRPESAWAAVEPMIRVVEGVEPPPFMPGFCSCVGELHLDAGDAGRAAEWFGRDLVNPGGFAAHLLAPQSRLGLARALLRSGEAGAGEHAALAARAGRELGMPGLLADAFEVAGLLETDRKKAEDAHHEALALRAEHGLRPGCVRSLEQLAGLAAAAGSDVEAARLQGACDRAREEFGMPAAEGESSPEREEGRSMSLEEAVAYARRARGSRARPSSGWASLTPTELSVVELAVTGMTNPEIAGKLFMSRATVKTHLSHAYAKLGIANRTQLATVERD
ncbi:LuxR C-terminal-related transcriptional regulator [Glycomyces sp. A-F 0318]|uniref:helix-turn-helix transcriptional regulator n=1 Tax=Glycomyces amatae TaxID=2881355 RepID=UPI001E348155|nr:LuxR C-terminal-related transcriptional regulator [Glycomyces amatae]MCD0445743.1 LuxR C-terminal-related transcriptional regulator [Glycomyces amatae]